MKKSLNVIKAVSLFLAWKLFFVLVMWILWQLALWVGDCLQQ